MAELFGLRVFGVLESFVLLQIWILHRLLEFESAFCMYQKGVFHVILWNDGKEGSFLGCQV